MNLTSIIIPAHNEQDYIQATIESYLRFRATGKLKE
jgi:glycosyltransferase involved in cell wall biosynthesis